MKIKKKYAYTKQKRVNFTQEQWNAALTKTLAEHPELALGKIEGIENLKIKTTTPNE